MSHTPHTACNSHVESRNLGSAFLSIPVLFVARMHGTVRLQSVGVGKELFAAHDFAFKRPLPVLPLAVVLQMIRPANEISIFFNSNKIV